MNHKILLAVLPVLFLTSACSFFGSEPPAPVKVAPKVTSAKKPILPSKPNISKTTPGTATYAIEPPHNSFKVESSTSSFHAEPMTLPTPVETPTVPVTPAITPPVAGQAGAVAATAATSGLIAAANPSPSAPPPLQIALEDAAIPAGTSPAVVALITQSDRESNKGDLDGAVVVMERALRIDSRNPTLTYKLAQLRIKQAKPQLAEELAGKAALLAGNNLDLKRKSWLLIAESRQMQHDYPGAKAAKLKADSFFGH
ncbi:tetratricopeptide repeat protein [Methylomonas paludis]|uniref:Tetratricopeptide repeat protein n=1 Tax=Methylomonas paludis TaxID=1173101 RepID=A0A975ML49_9GAMM|nr:tetratricopeptide repeat protein [Methylomonas paludis]QWF69599.1 tetratricopeptide repeat protein [Methylomonas paludis]